MATMSGILMFTRARLDTLLWGLGVGTFVYLIFQIPEVSDAFTGLCTNCWVERVDSPDVAAAATAAGLSVGSKAVKDIIDKKAGGPFTTWMDMYDIASQPTDEKQAEEAWKKYKSLIMTEHAPPGSAGDEINKAIDRFFDFSKDPDL